MLRQNLFAHKCDIPIRLLNRRVNYFIQCNQLLSLAAKFVVIVLCIRESAGGVCPPNPDTIKPCTCDPNTIRCYANNEFDLSVIFDVIASNRNENDKSFETLELSNNRLTGLEDSVFHGITFKTIKILHCNRLDCVSATAFSGMEKTLNSFQAYDTSFSITNQSDCNVFNALRRMQTLRSINITGSKLTEIPADAFQEANSAQLLLTTVDLSGGEGGNITKIGKNAFASLKNVRYIDLSAHKIDSIDSYAFAFNEPSNERLTINLENNRLNAESFAGQAIEGNGRPTRLLLGANPGLKVLKESVFRPFLTTAESGSDFWRHSQALILVAALTVQMVAAEGEDNGERKRVEGEGGCPAPDDIKPCTCKDKNLRCFSTIEFDLEQVFKAAGNGKTEEEKQFESLELSTPLIIELKDSIFHGVTFKTLKFLHCSKLNCISPTAFYGMERTLENFIGYDTSFSQGEKPGCNIFDSLRRLKSLRAINITGSRIREIPEGAFHETGSNIDKLTHIDLSGNQGGEITKIGRNAFASLKALKYIDLSQHQISKIDPHAFYFEDSSNEYLTINLESNLLTQESFEVESMSTNGRITTVKLGGNPNLQVLKDSVFRSFLLNTGRSNPAEQNMLDMRGSPLTCAKPNLWILESKFKLQRRINYVISAESGIEFWRHTPSQCDK
ncbi:unnamed protein product [Medioppia subpectinata]|uniref:Uncharacterized protein n=1 Tax=Medioppia subpectinata TaxID=1979941 RepID=A0A7R9PVJ8_9ACAR|nr:unnamed protein product [Medioppia subpectinata]CAG2102916.1 unnamed protein product [Medioppia subpectinata]